MQILDLVHKSWLGEPLGVRQLFVARCPWMHAVSVYQEQVCPCQRGMGVNSQSSLMVLLGTF